MTSQEMIHLFVTLVGLLLSVSLTQQAALKRDSSYYTAAVVEFHLHANEKETQFDNVEQYIKIIRSAEAKDADIIVFPESTLSNVGSLVPDPNGEYIVPCYDDTDVIIMKLSCAARETEKYIVVNLSEVSACDEETHEHEHPCSSTDLSRYNTNVVFDRKGSIISRYRKFHIFGENETITTLLPEIITFETDFDVTFGQLIGFDMVYKTPALDLGVRDFVYPTMWYSEAPFLTAVQLQQNWAYANDVNLLAAGANNPSLGNTGTGIYNGKLGPIVSAMHFEAESVVYVGKVEKFRNKNDIKSSAKTSTNMLDLHLQRDPLELSNHMKLNVTANSTKTKLCYYETCCDFKISLTVLHDTDSDEDMTYAYGYRLVVFDGVRSFQGVVTGGVFICGIVACLNSDDIFSCGLRFNKSQTVINTIQFNSIKLSGTFAGGEDVLSLPNSLNLNIMPFSVEDFVYEEGNEYQENQTTMRDIRYELIVSKRNLFSFGIYGRNFAKDGLPISGEYSAGFTLTSTINALFITPLFLYYIL